MDLSVRFAPSPTGVFHIGNLRTALAAHELAKSLGAAFVVRVEDLDKRRSQRHFEAEQLEDLTRLSIKPTSVYRQSDSLADAQTLLERGIAGGFVYPCRCSRKDVVLDLQAAPHKLPNKSSTEAGTEAATAATSAVYSGRCRRSGFTARAGEQVVWRFHNRNQTGCDDFIVGHGALRPDGVLEGCELSYHFACAFDDVRNRHDVIVRAWDLAPALLPQSQIWDLYTSVMQQPSYRPRVYHTSLVVDREGRRLEKRSQGVRLDDLVGVGMSVAEIRELLAESLEACWDLVGETNKQIVFDSKRRKFFLD